MKTKARTTNNFDNLKRFSLNRNELDNLRGGRWVKDHKGKWIWKED